MTLSEQRRTDRVATTDSAADAEMSDASPTDSCTTRRWSRRSVLRTAAMGVGTVAVVATGASSYRVFVNSVLDPDGGHAYDMWRNWRNVHGALGAVAAATLAASPHNTQPWTFHVTDSSIDVFDDPSRRIDALDPFGREHFVGLGCALENLVIAAARQGLSASVALSPDGSASDHVAHVELAPGSAAGNSLFEAIGHRRSNRGPYRSRAMTDSVLDGLVDTSGLPGVTVQWIVAAEERSTFGQLLVDAAMAVTADERQSRDSFAWLRMSDAEIQRYRDGLTLDAQGLSTVVLTMAKLLPASTRTAGDTFWVQQTRDVHTRTAAAYGIVTAADPGDKATQLIGGRMLQRIHLKATASGIAMQHMNQITERIDRERVTGADATFAQRFAALLPSGELPLVTFRVGYADRAARLSPRRALTAVMQ